MQIANTATSPVMATNSDLPVVVQSVDTLKDIDQLVEVQNIDIDLPIEAQNYIFKYLQRCMNVKKYFYVKIFRRRRRNDEVENGLYRLGILQFVHHGSTLLAI